MHHRETPKKPYWTIDVNKDVDTDRDIDTDMDVDTHIWARSWGVFCRLLVFA